MWFTPLLLGGGASSGTLTAGTAFQSDAFQNNAFQIDVVAILATIAFTLDDVSVSMSATNSSAPVTGYIETLIVLRTFTDRKRF